jgi:hypothetical protein
MSAGVGEHDVFRLDVTMEDAPVVRSGESGGELAANAAELIEGERSREPRPECFALDVLHDEVDLAAFGEDIVDGGDAGVVKRGGALAFKQEALAIRLGTGALGALDGDETAKGGVARTVDLAHTAGAEACLDMKAAGQDTAHSGERSRAYAHLTIERRGIGHCVLVSASDYILGRQGAEDKGVLNCGF